MFSQIFFSQILCKCVSIWKASNDILLIFFYVLLSHRHYTRNNFIDVLVVLVDVFVNVAALLVAVNVCSGHLREDLDLLAVTR